jgi:hypothetical protein
MADRDDGRVKFGVQSTPYKELNSCSQKELRGFYLQLRPVNAIIFSLSVVDAYL